VNPILHYANVAHFSLYADGNIVGYITALTDARAKDFGILGFFECENNPTYAAMLFDEAEKFLTQQQRTVCYGPINMTTWQTFRLSFPESNPPYFLEPFSREYYRTLFLEHGFAVEQCNETHVAKAFSSGILDYEQNFETLVAQGFTFDRLDKENASGIIKDIYSLTSSIFAHSYAFYSITLDEFIYNLGQRENMSRNYVYVARDKDGEALGYIFAMPDLFSPKQQTVVFKTMGVKESARGRGIGKSLLYVALRDALSDGNTEVLYSTMSEKSDAIHSLTSAESTLYRKYETYKKEINIC
jgi:L-amino acid N-acyltransferase YncA